MQHITQEMVQKALSDSSFKSRFPEFTAPTLPTPTSGCRGCAARAAMARVTPTFYGILSKLPVSRLVEIKNYFGAKGIYVTRTTAEGGTFMDVITDEGSLYEK